MRSTALRDLFRHVLSVSVIAPLVTAGAAACSGAIEDTPDGGTDAATADGSKVDAQADGGGGTCEPPSAPRWNKPGCGRPADVCFAPGTPEPDCYGVVCGCSGKVISGCMSFTEPYVALPSTTDPEDPFPAVGTPCDPNPKPDAGLDASRDVNVADGCVQVPQPVVDAGFSCESWTVPMPCTFPADASSVTSAECKSFCGPNANYCYPTLGGSTLSCDPGCAVGRRPEGFAAKPSSRSGDAATITGVYFAAMAELEAASVFSFERLARELEAHGAPADLRRRARRAAEDERRHARVASALAERFGGTTELPSAPSMEIRPLEAIALENAVEGCVRETFGALTATLQAERARDPRVRAAMRKIAVDETAHAGLAWAVAEWLDPQLDAAAKERLQAARAQAILELRKEVCTPQPAQLQSLAGLPDAKEAERMLDTMTQTLWDFPRAA